MLSRYPGSLPTILDGILRYGALVGYMGSDTFTISNNLTSAENDPDMISNQVTSDLACGRVSATTPTAPFVSSPLGLVPKSDTGWRRIHHLSHPPGISVNDGIPQEFGALRYTALHDMLDVVRQAGRACHIVKKDLKDAFRMIPVAMSVRRLLGFTWQGRSYTENCLPFGLRTAPFIFNLFAEALHWILEVLLPNVLLRHYLDDFIFVLPAGDSHRAPLVHETWRAITDFLGLYRNDSKDAEGTCVEVLGIEVDTMSMQARLSSRKVTKANSLITNALTPRTVTLRRIQELTGFLSFCTAAIPIGRTCLSGLWQFQSLFSPAQPVRRLTQGARADLLWWQELLIPDFNGTLLLTDTGRPVYHLFTDASDLGIGGFFYRGDVAQSDWRSALPLPQAQAFARARTANELDHHINVTEIVAVAVAVATWAHRWHHATLVIHTDNTTAQAGFTSGYTRVGPATESIRSTLLRCAALDIRIHCVRVTSAANGLADALSRLDWPTVANLCPNWQTPL